MTTAPLMDRSDENCGQKQKLGDKEKAQNPTVSCWYFHHQQATFQHEPFEYGWQAYACDEKKLHNHNNKMDS